MESRIRIHCECGKTGLVDRKHIGKTITCPKCGVARIKVEDPEARLKTNDIGGTLSVGSKPSADAKVKISPSPPTLPTELSRNQLWTGRNILIGVLTLAILAVVLVPAIILFSGSSDLPNTAIADVAVKHTDKREDELLPEIAEQAEPKEVVKAADVAEKQPAVVLPPTPAEKALIEFERLRALVREIARDHNLAAAPVSDEWNKLRAELADQRRSPRLTEMEGILARSKELSSTTQVLKAKYEIRVATEVKEYIKRLEDLNIPEGVSTQCEQDEIKKIILANDSSPASVKALVERMEQGGDHIMKTRQGRMWVAFGVKFTL